MRVDSDDCKQGGHREVSTGPAACSIGDVRGLLGGEAGDVFVISLNIDVLIHYT